MSAAIPVLVIALMVALNALVVARDSHRAKRLDAVAACQIGITLSSLVAGAYGQAQLTRRPFPRWQFSQWLFRPLVAVFTGSAFKLMKLWNLQIDHTYAHVHSPEEPRRPLPRQCRRWSHRRVRARHARRDPQRRRPTRPRDQTPRPRLVTVPHTISVADALARRPHTRFPVRTSSPPWWRTSSPPPTAPIPPRTKHRDAVEPARKP